MAEATKPELQEQLTQAQRQLTDVTHERDALKLEVQGHRDALTVAANEKSQLEAQLGDERARSGDAAGELNEAQNLIDDLQQRLQRAERVASQSDAVLVSDGTHDYKVLAPKFKFRHTEYTAEQLKEDEQLVRELVAAGVGFLAKIEAAQ